MTIQPWEVRDADGFDRVFAALGKQRPDGLSVAGGRLMGANQKRIADFALKSRLPSMYSSREAVDAGGLMSYASHMTVKPIFAHRVRRHIASNLLSC